MAQGNRTGRRPAIADSRDGKVILSPLVNPQDRAGLGIDAAGEYIGVARTTIYTLLGKGLIKSVRIGARHIILRSSLDDYILSLQPKSESGG
jgi:excisionase family DNA binding protein